MLDLIEPYRLKLHSLIDLESVYGFATKLVRRFGFDGGDSPLGNLVAESIRQYARADFGMTNSLGIRTDLPFKEAKGQLVEIFELSLDEAHIAVGVTEPLAVFIDVGIGHGQLFRRHVDADHAAILTDQL